MIRRALCVLAIALILPIFQSQRFLMAAPPDADWGLEKLLADVCRKHDVPSLTIAVVRSDGLVTAKCSGVRKRGTDDAVSLTDRHPLGSCTKSLTSTLAAVLVESGKIGWDTTISEVWPGADAQHLHPSLRDVTLNELLSHQSGLQSDLDGNDWLSFFAEKSSPPLERRRMLHLILKRKPAHKRGEFHYSNLGYVIVAAILEKKGGDSFENLMRRNVFEPLKMSSAGFRTLASAKKLKAPLRWGHLASGDPIDPRIAGAENPSVYAACGTVNMTIADYAKYAQWHLSGKPAPLLSNQKTLDHLHAGHVDRPGGGKYGCGWIVLNVGLGRALNHGGSNTNSRALIWILPDKNFAAVACTNTGEQSGFLASDEVIVELMKRYAR